MQWKTILCLAVSASALGLGSAAQAQTAGVVSDAEVTGRPQPILGVGFFDLSGDGTAIAGTVRNDATTYSAYRITTTGYEALPGVNGHVYVMANGVSDNGSVIVGSSAQTYISTSTAMVWEGASATALPHLGSASSSIANGVSGDGTVVVGSSAAHAVRWVNKGSPDDLNGGGFSGSFAQRASRNGSVIIGYGSNATRTNEGFVWTSANGMTGLGVLSSQSSDAGAYSRATDVSADGAVVVGFSAGSNDRAQAFRWTSGGGMVSLGLLPSGQDSRAFAVNADGSVIVGSATRPSAVVPSIQDTLAFRWTSAGGLQTVADWLTANGVSVGNNSFTDAKGVSDDGRVIIGKGQINGTTQQYIARVASGSTGGGTGGGGSTGGSSGGSTGGGTGGSTGGSTSGGTGSDTGGTSGGSTGGGSTGGGTGGGTSGGTADGTGVIGLVDYLHSAAQGGGVTFQTVINAATLTLFGAHHRPLMDFAQPGRTCAWATGDFAGSGNASGDRRNYLGEMGLCHDLGSNIRVGLGAGYGGSHQDLSLGGRSEAEGFNVIGEIDVKVPATPILFSVTGYYADWNVEIARAYMNGANIDISRGKTDARTWALRGRIDLQDAVRLGPVTLSPFAAYTHARVKLDGYAEDGGAFDAVYQDTIDHVSELRLGSAAAVGLGDKARLRLSGEWVRRLDDAAVTVVGFESAVGTFALTAALGDRDWGRIGADIDVNIGKGALLTLSAHRMLGDGQDARLGGSVSLRFGF